jgi:hypothetical protein
MTQNQAARAFALPIDPRPPARGVRDQIDLTAEAVLIADGARVAHVHGHGWERRGLLQRLRRKRHLGT